MLNKRDARLENCGAKMQCEQNVLFFFVRSVVKIESINSTKSKNSV